MRSTSKGLLLLFAACLSWGTLGAQESPDEMLAQSFTDRAYDAYLQGNIDHAARYAAQALSFVPDSLDALFLSLLPLVEDRSQTGRVISSLERVLAQGSLEKVSFLDVATMLAKLYLRVRNYEQGYALLDRPLIDGDALLTKIQLMRALQDPRLFDEIARARSLYPQDFRFTEQFLRALPTVDAATLASILASDDRSPAYFSTLFFLIERTEDPALREVLLARYNEEGSDPLSGIYAQRHSESEPELEFLPDKFILDTLASMDALPDALRDETLRYEGPMYYDADRDGFWEQYFTVSAGQVSAWYLDENQDGRNEVEVLFDGGFPSEATLRAGENEYTYRYGTYPFLRRVISRAADASLSEFLLHEGSISLPLFEGPLLQEPAAVLSVFTLSEGLVPLSVEELLQSTSLRYLSETKSVQLFDHRALWMQMRDTNDDGAIDEIVYMDRGVPSLRFSDKDFNGYFEAATRYLAGRAISIDVDEDEDSYIEAVQTLSAFVWEPIVADRAKLETEDLQELLDYAETARVLLEASFDR